MPFKKNTLLIIAFWLLLVSIVRGQGLEFHHLSEADGIPKGTVLCFEQDQHGFLWVGTTDGLYRYDGKEFRAFYYNRQDSSSLSNNRVRNILEDSKGRIWVGTKLGLNCYLQDEDRFVRHLYEKGDDFESENYIHSILEDSNGKIWYGTYNGLFYFDTEKEELLQFLPQEENPMSMIGATVWQVIEDRKGRLWMGTNSGFSIYQNDGSFQFEQFEPKFNQDKALTTERIWSFGEQEDGTIWFGSYNGLYRVDERKTPWQFQRFQQEADNDNSLSYNFIRSNFIEGNDRLWVGTWAGGLNEIHLFPNHPDSIRFIRHQHQADNPKSIGNDKVIEVFRDRSGILWVATGSSLDKVAPYLTKFNSVVSTPGGKGSLNNDIVKATLRDRQGNLWIGTVEGLHFLSAENLAKKNYNFTLYTHQKGDPNSISHNNIYDLMEDSRGYLWIATYNGLNYIDLSTFAKKPVFRNIGQKEGIPHTFVYSSIEIEPGVYWVATYGGLARMYFDVETSKKVRLEIFQMDKNQEDALVNSTCYKLVKDRFGNFWVGTFIGLSKIVEREGQTFFENYKFDSNDPHSLSNNSISTMHVDQKGNLWVGTRGGLNLVEQNGAEGQARFRVFGREEGISNEVIQGIEEDDLGRLWLGTNDGLFRFDMEKAIAGEKNAVKRYGLEDGLVSSGIIFRSSSKDQEGNIYLGGSNGFSYFHPEKIQENKHIPPVVFTELKVLNEVIQPTAANTAISKKAIHLTDTIFLKHWQNILSLKFAALDFANPRQNQYAHQLVGLNPDWVYTQNDNSVTFTNLPSGTHELLVKGSNNDGLWNEEPTRMFIVVAPPPWKTTWAYVLYLLTFGAIIYAFIRWRIQQRIQKIEQQTELEKARFQGREELRKQNAADFHDELGHRLSLIALYLELAERQSKQRQENTNYFEKIKTNTVALSSGIRDLIWSLDPQKDSLGQTLLRLQEFGDRLFAYSNTHFKTTGLSEDLETIHLEPDIRKHLLLLFKEAMNNVLKYAQASQVRLSVAVKPTFYLIQLQDDGQGFDPKAVDSGYGLKNMKERALKMNAQLSIESNLETGTRILLKLAKN